MESRSSRHVLARFVCLALINSMCFTEHASRNDTIDFAREFHYMTSSTGNPLVPNLNLNYTHHTGEVNVEHNSSRGVPHDTLPLECHLRSLDPHLFQHIRQMVEVERMNLIEYRLNFPGYNLSSPLVIPGSVIYKSNVWARASTRHGQTLLSLSFNYGILSMMSLSVGTNSLDVPLIDEPEGCFGEQNGEEQFGRILDLLFRDFTDSNSVVVEGDERICYETISNQTGYGRFFHVCCSKQNDSSEVVCEPDVVNIWLRLIQTILAGIRVVVIFVGPVLIMPTIVNTSRKQFAYIVELKEPLVKTVCLVDCEDDFQASNLKSMEHILDLRSNNKLPKFKKSIQYIQTGVVLPVKISQFDILVSYKRLLAENSIPVGFWRSIFGAVFQCKLKDISPFKLCCQTDMFRSFSAKRFPRKPRIPWIRPCSMIASVLLILSLPSPYYLRLVLFYIYEYYEVMSRKTAVEELGLKESFSNNPLHYFLPTHPLFVIIYLVYFVTAIVIGLTARKGREGVIVRIFAESFEDLSHLPWTAVLRIMTGNMIWPFKQFGVVGCLVAPVYWPIGIPVTVLLFAVYCLPTVYLTVRMFHYSHQILFGTAKPVQTQSLPYRARQERQTGIEFFDVERLFCFCWKRNPDGDTSVTTSVTEDSTDSEKGLIEWGVDGTKTVNRLAKTQKSPHLHNSSHLFSDFKRLAPKLCLSLLASSLCVISLYSILVILSECIGCFMEMALFTLMGVIVNAGVLLKYVALIILLVVYSHDCFKTVQKNYAKLNKALFSEVKSRIKDLERVTCRPAHLQENNGFKAQELSEQAFYESPDDLVLTRHQHCWLINDLVLFVDNEDMPRIPRKLFDEVCEIRVAGVPGPAYVGHLKALQQFSKIVIFVGFVFVVVLTFSETHGMSSTNQMLATLAGGFLPLILRTLMGASENTELELGTLSFRSKLDEVIKNFRQVWPIYDFPFELIDPSKSEEDSTIQNSVDINFDTSTSWSENEEYGNVRIDSIGKVSPLPTETVNKVNFQNCGRLDIIKEKVDLVIRMPEKCGTELWLDE